MKVLRLNEDSQIMEVIHCEYGGVFVEIKTIDTPIYQNIVLSEKDVEELIKFLKDE